MNSLNNDIAGCYYVFLIIIKYHNLSHLNYH